MRDESVTVRNPKGKLRFLLGPMDPRARRRYINAGTNEYFDVIVKLMII